MMPKDENELRHMLKTALDYEKGPIAVRYPRINGTGVTQDKVMMPLPIGTWEVVHEGEGVAVLAVGPMVQIAEEAAKALKAQGINLRVINARFIKPLDENMLLKLSKERTQLITMEEAALLGGFGSAVLEFYAKKEITGVQVKCLGVPDYYVEHGSIPEQRAEVGLTVEKLIEQVKLIMPRKRQRALM
jgi:1-deoxy-D-xylulose-5-phosphate synthase